MERADSFLSAAVVIGGLSRAIVDDLQVGFQFSLEKVVDQSVEFFAARESFLFIFGEQHVSQITAHFLDPDCPLRV